MKTAVLSSLILVCLCSKCFAQFVQLFYDTEHYAAVTVNQAARMSAEMALTNQTRGIRDNVETINQNLLKVVAAREIIYNSLVQVNEILKDGREVKYIGTLMADILHEATGVVDLARQSPHLAIFAEERVSAIKKQSLDLFAELSAFINKGGSEAMMNYSTRDALLRNITHRLQLLRAEVYLMHQAMYWARLNGIWNMLSPFTDWINEDRAIINGILFNLKLIQQ